jgi:hypothetical protein
MKNKNLVIIHHPGVYSIRDTFTGDQKLPRILEQSSKNTSIPDQFKKQLTQSLLDHYIVIVDGFRVYGFQEDIIPKKSVVIIASNKIVFRGTYASDMNNHITHCSVCRSERPVVYQQANDSFCEECYINWFEDECFKELNRRYDEMNHAKKIMILFSGERDSTTAAVVLLKYLKKKNIPIRPRLEYCYFISGDQGNYRLGCKKASEAFASKYNLELIVHNMRDKYDVDFYEMGCAIENANYPVNIDPGLCDYCEYCFSLVTETPYQMYLKERVKNDTDEVEVVGSTLSDHARDLIVRAGTGFSLRSETDDLRPLRNVKDLEVSIYAALTKIDFHIGDCPFKKRAPLYERAHELQMIEMVLPNLSRRAVQTYFKNENEKWVNPKFTKIYDLWNPQTTVVSGATGHPFPFYGSIFALSYQCPDCGNIIPFHNIASVLGDKVHQDCPSIPDSPEKQQFIQTMGQIHNKIRLAIDSKTIPEDVDDKTHFCFAEHVEIEFGNEAILLWDKKQDIAIAVNACHHWQKELIRRLNQGWISTEKLISLFPDFPAHQVKQYISFFNKTGLVSESNAMPDRLIQESPASITPLDMKNVAIVDHANFLRSDKWSKHLFGENACVYSAQNIPDLYQPIQDFEQIVFMSNISDAHLQIARICRPSGQTVLHCGMNANYFYIGPLSSKKVNGCYQCFVNESIRLNVPFENNQKNAITAVIDYEKLLVFSGLIQAELRQLQQATKMNNKIKCFDMLHYETNIKKIIPLENCKICNSKGNE